MQALRKLTPGQRVTKRYLARDGNESFCVRYRYSRENKRRYTTVEIIVDEAAWSPPPLRIAKATIVGVRIEIKELDLQSRARRAGANWNRKDRLWEMRYDQALALGLEKRIEQPGVSNTRHLKVSNTRHP